MDKVYDAVLNKLSGPSSRRSFLGNLGKLALAGGAIAAGLGPGAVLAQDCGCCPNGCNGCINPAPESLDCTAGNPTCCFIRSTGYYYSYTPCQGCLVGQFQCCSGSTDCAGPLGTCGFAPVHRS